IRAHRADAEIVGAYRIRATLGSPGGPVAAYDQDAWAAAGRYTARDPLKSLELFRVVREANLALLASLAPEQWHDYGVHSERGRESIEHLVRMFAGHASITCGRSNGFSLAHSAAFTVCRPSGRRCS